jgi:hypothetical protein
MTRSAAVADAFVELVCTDRTLLRLEFDSIVAAGLRPAGDEPAPASPGRRPVVVTAVVPPRPAVAHTTWARSATGRCRARPQYPRERSPPARRFDKDEEPGR